MKKKLPYPIKCKQCKYITVEKFNGEKEFYCEKYNEFCACIKKCKKFKTKYPLITSLQDVSVLINLGFGFVLLILLILHMIGVIDINELFNNK